MAKLSVSNYFRLLHRIDRSLDSLLTFICTRNCCNWHITSPGPGNFQHVFWSHHSYTGLSKHIWDGSYFTESQVLKFENDIEHGVAHGVFTYLAANLYEPRIGERLLKRTHNSYDSLYRTHDKGKYNHDAVNEYYDSPTDDEKLVPCCLFHDMYKCIFSDEHHDTLLKEYFPRLDPAAYSHSNPGDEHINHPLIRGDRLELLRYDNADTWVDYDKIFDKIQPNTKEQILFFYDRVRPVIEKSFRYRNDRWIRHGVEEDVDKYNLNSTMYPVLSSLESVDEFIVNRDENEKYWAVELAKGPLGTCISQKLDNRKMSICKPGHAGKATRAWEALQGKMPLREYNKKLHSCKVRDHLYGYGQLPMKDWIFSHKDIQHDLMKPILDSDIKICHDKIVHKYLHVTEKIIDLLYGIKTTL